MSILETEQLILHPFRFSDSGAFAEFRSDPQIAHLQSWNLPFRAEQTAAFFEQMKQVEPGIAAEWYYFAIEKKQQAGVIGYCALHVFSDQTQQGEIGLLFSRRYQRRTYVLEVLMQLIDFGFDELTLYRITANCDRGNTATARLLRRASMRQEGNFVTWFRGRWGNEYLFSIQRSEWRRKDGESSALAPAL